MYQKELSQKPVKEYIICYYINARVMFSDLHIYRQPAGTFFFLSRYTERYTQLPDCRPFHKGD